ncbi:MAG: DUF366 family protein [Bacillota bacterium]|nr:DUF366 family protein [Bacillota bacterium]
MHVHLVPDSLTYDGTQLRPHWAFRRFRLQGDSIVTFRGPCRVELEHMVDLQDVLDEAPIFSPDMLHFIVEHFDTDLQRGILRQRLLIALIREILAERGGPINRRGDDLFVGGLKLSVSIATVSPMSTLIHTGLNVRTEGVPVPAVGLTQLGWADVEIQELAARIARNYAEEMAGVHLARCKVRGVG